MKLFQLITYIKTIIFLYCEFSQIVCLKMQMRQIAYLIKLLFGIKCYINQAMNAFTNIYYKIP